MDDKSALFYADTQHVNQQGRHAGRLQQGLALECVRRYEKCPRNATNR
jgi:hypothetical protein